MRGFILYVYRNEAKEIKMSTLNINSTIKTKDHDGYKLQTVEEKMWVLSKVQHEFVECMTPEGPSDDFSWKIVLENFFTGSVYELNSEIVGKIISEDYEDKESGYCETVTYYKNGRSVADDLIEKIKAKGVVDLNRWNKVK